MPLRLARLTRALLVAIGGSLLPQALLVAQNPPDLSGIPKAVLGVLEARFPGAEIRVWTEEHEDGVTLYDLEFTQNGRKLEADIRADGTILNWEEAIAIANLPAAARRAVDARYPGCMLQEVMRITAVADAKETIEGYEVVLTTAAGDEVEVTVAPDGKILEDSGEGG